MKKSFRKVVLFSLLSLSVKLMAEPLGIIVPAYFNPATRTNEWREMATAAGQVPLMAVMNPSSGPGTVFKPAYLQGVTNLQAHGGKVLGYVSTAYSSNSLDQVQADIERYLAWYPVNGFFIDEMSNKNTTAALSYYATIYQYIKARDPGFTVVGNPGTTTAESYAALPCADIFVVYESGTGYAEYSPSAWNSLYPSSILYHLPYAVPDADSMTNCVALAASRNAGWVYITDDGGDNPWDTMPTYWEAEVSLIEWLNGAASPVTTNTPPVVSEPPTVTVDQPSTVVDPPAVVTTPTTDEVESDVTSNTDHERSENTTSSRQGRRSSRFKR